MNKNIYEVLKDRELIKQITFEDEFKKVSSNEIFSVYLGIDPTANSIHIGHFIPLMMMSYFQECGHRPIIIVGGGTATIGDPSGKTDMRKMLTREDIDKNVECIKNQVKKFISFEGENAAIIVNNADWILAQNYIEFVSKIGVHFNVNRMLAAECYKQRMEKGLTFFELNYMIMQSYDFLHLFENYNCKVQIGGDDQWSNMLGGVDLIRKLHKNGSFCITCPLLLNSEGLKMGKTVNGALWLSSEKTSVFDFYQYWRNIKDDEVYNVLRMLTKLDMNEVKRLSNLEGSDINEAKKIAAYEITKLIHGEQEALKAKEAAESLFENGNTSDNMNLVEVNKDTLNILDLLILCGITTSKSQGRTLISQGGIFIDEEKVSDDKLIINKPEFVIRKGKKTYIKVIVK